MFIQAQNFTNKYQKGRNWCFNPATLSYKSDHLNDVLKQNLKTKVRDMRICTSIFSKETKLSQEILPYLFAQKHSKGCN